MKREDPIVKTLLDADLYKYTMMYFIWKLFPNATAKFVFHNRTKKVRLAETIDMVQLREELDVARSLSIPEAEIGHLETLGLFDDNDFFDFLRLFRLPEISVEKDLQTGQLRIETDDDLWMYTSLWETIVLMTISQLYAETLCEERGIGEDDIRRVGTESLLGKIERLNAAGHTVPIMEFGTRRRPFGWWHEEMLGIFLDYGHKHLVGTSNVHLARKFGIPCKGTFAHELYMGLFGIMMSGALGRIDEGSVSIGDIVRRSHDGVLDLWRQTFGDRLLIALSDTYGSEFFFETFGEERARWWRGLRQDSGDPIAFGERQITYYEGLGIDPREKLFVPSDGLDIDLILDIFSQFSSRTGLLFGWGTTLGNDVGLSTLSIVMKLARANGCSTVKLSDNPAKAMGPNALVEKIMEEIGYRGGDFKECAV